eukprot:6175138-Prymnesium_polylepis.1
MAIAAVDDGSEGPPPVFDEAFTMAEMAKIGTVGIRLDAPKMLSEMQGVVMRALLKLRRAGILFGSISAARRTSAQTASSTRRLRVSTRSRTRERLSFCSWEITAQRSSAASTG